jgi:hypothetical protein
VSTVPRRANDAGRCVGLPIITEAHGRKLWRLSVTTYLLLCAWIIFDAMFVQAALALPAAFRGMSGLTELRVYSPQLAWRMLALAAVVFCAAASLVGVLATLFLGATRHRGVKSWLAFTTLVAAWLSLTVSWSDLAWQGQQWRVRAHLPDFDTLAASLNSAWPEEDGQRPALGAFMAYPHGQPRVLLLLSAPQSGLSFSAVERSDRGGLRFELAGNESGSWLEWHSPGDRPASFVGGLLGHYTLDRCADLGDGWFLTRYRT